MQNDTRMNEITKYPLFGKVALIKDEIFGGLAYQEPGSGCIMSPAFRGGKAKSESIIYTDVRCHIFSNGTEAEGWFESNCYRCSKQLDIREPTDLRQGGCALEFRLGMAYVDDGKIPFKTVRRIGYLQLVVQNNGVFAHLSDCKEFVQK